MTELFPSLVSFGIGIHEENSIKFTRIVKGNEGNPSQVEESSENYQTVDAKYPASLCMNLNSSENYIMKKMSPDFEFNFTGSEKCKLFFYHKIKEKNENRTIGVFEATFDRDPYLTIEEIDQISMLSHFIGMVDKSKLS